MPMTIFAKVDCSTIIPLSFDERYNMLKQYKYQSKGTEIKKMLMFAYKFWYFSAYYSFDSQAHHTMLVEIFYVYW